MIPRPSSIARRTGVLQAAIAAVGLLFLAPFGPGVAAAIPDAAHSDDPPPPDGFLEALLDFMRALCEVLHCAGGPAGHGMSQDDAIAQCAVDQILSYSLDGIAPDLSDDQRNAGLTNIDDVRLLLDASPGALSGDLTAQYTATLEAMRDDLSR